MNSFEAVKEMYAKLDKIATWLERNAKHQREFSKSTRFQSLAESSNGDAKNFEATAADIRKLMNQVSPLLTPTPYMKGDLY